MAVAPVALKTDLEASVQTKFTSIPPHIFTAAPLPTHAASLNEYEFDSLWARTASVVCLEVRRYVGKLSCFKGQLGRRC